MHILSTCIFNSGVGPWTDQGNMLRIQGDQLYCLPNGVGMIHNNFSSSKERGPDSGFQVLDSSIFK